MPELHVEHAMTAAPPSINLRASVRTAAERMCALNTTFLVAHDGDSASVGLVTDRDLTGLIATGRDPTTTTVGEVMTPQTVFCHTSDDVEDAVWLMERHELRRLVVVDDDRRVVGVLSVDDVARALSTRLAGSVLRHTPAST